MTEYIDKKLAIELMHQSSYLSDGDLLEVNGNLAKERIEAEPAADVVKVRHAKDVYKQYNKHHCEFMCSLCGGWIGVIEGGDCDFNYCPKCGAKMDLEMWE